MDSKVKGSANWAAGALTKPKRCLSDEQLETTHKLDLRIAGIFIIMAISVLGIYAPMLAQLYIARAVNRGGKAFGIDVRVLEARLAWVLLFLQYFGYVVITGMALLHMLPDGHEALRNPCLPEWVAWTHNLSFVICFSTMLLTAGIDMIAFNYGFWTKQKAAIYDYTADPILLHANGLDCGKTLGASSTEEYIQQQHAIINRADKRKVYRIYYLVIGAIVHSLVLGMSLSLTSDKRYEQTFSVFVVHQLGEALSFGTILAKLVGSKAWIPWVFAGLYSIAMSSGTGAGTFMNVKTNVLGHPNGFLARGILSCMGAGMIIYVGVQMLVKDSGMGDDFQHKSKAYRLAVILGVVAGGIFTGVFAYLDNVNVEEHIMS